MELRKVRDAVYEGQPEGAKVPVRIYATEAMIKTQYSPRTLNQAANVAKLPGILNAAMVMPDGHEGYGFPIGGVAGFDLTEGVVSPGGVGYDINCGVRLIRTNLTEKEVRPKLKELVNALFQNVPAGVGGKGRVRLTEPEMKKAVEEGVDFSIAKGYAISEDKEHCEEEGFMPGADFSQVSQSARSRGLPQFGTLGSGNHFCEVQKVEKIFHPEAAKRFGLEDGQVCIMVHCGSRGYGHQICDDNIRVMLPAAQKYGIKLPDRELCCAPLGSPEANSYFAQMNSAINFAFNNRQFITHWIRESFQTVFKRNWDQMDMQLVYDVCHNIAKFEEHQVDGQRKKICIHRKGATRALWAGRPEVPKAYRDFGHPVLIPGSMNTASYVLVGMPTAEETFGSSAHGAGRVMSRTQALETFDGRKLEADMRGKGQEVRATSLKGLAEEAGGAYKDVDQVVAATELAGISRIVAKLVPLAVVKG